MMNNLANILTVARVLLLPFIILLLFLPFHWAAWLCLILYIVAAITDFLDGWVARKYNQITAFGRFLDPIADKIFVVTILLMLVAVDRITGFSVLAVVAILAREFAVSGLREFLGPKNITVHVTPLAKWKTTLQMLATGCLIVEFTSTWVEVIGLLSLWAAAFLTVYTGWQYIRVGMKHIND
ncbi:MAG: CDP-diacylglycerol--glycerol-3-phosphate 3-phosphatidyltransferase [Alphaproteobacteria bacterium]|nr:CDP-diacylglycerol--glycerol-3-phosphate 3-phosphatidyltransferase [Alphaproteobacteria bacterium]MBU0859596.1 CDP-diacylglycerol--glycerol-3-phosphate 3-phosphatidyltransferase [Alphaproteobacteria bacterium]